MPTPIQFTVYPDECDAFGHLNQASYLALFERARWEMLARGPGMDAFPRAGMWPVVRRAVIDFHTGAWPGDILRFTVEVLHRGRTSFTLKQIAVRTRDERLVATAEIVFVCIDEEEHPVPVPESILAALGMEPRRIALPNGLTLAVEDVGRGGIPVLFVHGFPLDRELWAAQLSGLRGHRLIAPDLRGFGLSEAPVAATSLANYSDDLIALLDELGVGKAVVCGLSMGGYVVFDLVRRYRDRVAGLILMDTRAPGASVEGRAGQDKLIEMANTGGAAAIAQNMAERLFAERTPQVVRDAVTSRMQRTPLPAVLAGLVAIRDRADSVELLGALAGIPTLVIVGKEDRITPPADARQIASGIPGATLVEIEAAGHLPPLEQPEAVTRAIQGFLDRLG